MRILVAEDDPVIALGLAERLRRLGHEPLGPEPDGHRAIARARASDPDLYLFDIDMPGLDGLAAAEALSREGLRRPVVAITGVRDPGLIDRSIATGVSAYLTKPIDDIQLDAAIRLAAARHAEFLALEAEVDRAHHALEDRKLVERAKGLLMQALAISEAEAFTRIKRSARNRNLRLADVARAIIEQRDLMQTPGRDDERPARTALPEGPRTDGDPGI
jgi:AmiR/NasT family two-component response regulator